MAQPKRAEWTIESHRPATAPAAAGPAFPARALPHGPSPAHQLQQLLEERALAEPDVQRWSQRRALAFIVASSAALWLALIAAGAEAIKLIA